MLLFIKVKKIFYGCMTFYIAFFTCFLFPSMPMSTQGGEPAVVQNSMQVPQAVPAVQAAPIVNQQTVGIQKQNFPQVQPVQSASLGPVAEDAFKVELDEIHSSMSEIDRLQDKLDREMEELVKNIGEAQSKIAEAKKMSFAILQEESEDKAHKLFEEENDLIQQIRTMQDRLQGDLNKNFTETSSELKAAITRTEALATRLKAKIATYQIIHPVVVKQGSAEKNRPEAKKVEELSIAASLINLLSVVTAKVIKLGRQVKVWITSFFSDEVKKKPENLIKNQIQAFAVLPQVTKFGFGLYAAAPQQPFVPVPQYHQSVSGFVSPPKTILEFRQAAQTYVDTLAAITKQLDQLRIFLTQQSEAVAVMRINLKNLLTTATPIKNYLELKKKQEEERKPPYWKKFSVQVFEKCLDLGASLINYVVRMVKSSYNYFFASLVHKFSVDVKEKLETIEEEKNEQKLSAPAQNSLPLKQKNIH
jgi:uncharacterized protein YukE